MVQLAPGEVTQFLAALSAGRQEALPRLIPLVYAELRTLAGRLIRRERRDHTLSTTALVHEAYLRLALQHNVEWEHRAHFFSVAAQMMRRILVDHARKVATAKRGDPSKRVALQTDFLPGNRRVDVLGIHESLEDLAKFDPQQSRIVELRFFGGLTIAETAEILEVSPATVKREWTVAKAWLKRELELN